MAPDQPLAPETPADELPPPGAPVDGEAADGAAWPGAAAGGGEDLSDERLDALDRDGEGEAAAPPDGEEPQDPEIDGAPASGGGDDGDEPAAGYTGRVSVGSAQAGHQAFANTIYMSCGDFRTRAPERLARKHCETFELAALARRLRGMEWPGDALRLLEQHAEGSRFLILSGEAGLGKGSLALALAEKLLRRQRGPQRALLAGRPPRDLQVDLARVAGEEKESVVVVEDAFVHANPSLCRLVEELDVGRLRSLDEALRGAGCWVLLTATPESLPGDAVRLDGLGARVPLAEPPRVELRRALHRLAQLRLAGDGCGDDDRAAVDRLLEGAADAICERLRTLPRVAAFVDGYLLAAARGGGWEAAADRVDGLADWLFEELPEEAPAWSFALSLTLAGAVPALGDPPLFAFDALWRRLDAVVREELAGEPPAARPLAALGVGDRLLRCTRSEIAGSRPPTVRFRDPHTSGRLWRALLDGPGRPIASLLAGWLREMVDSDQLLLRETAARALGRVGVLDPGHVTLPLVDRWVRDADDRCFDGTLGGILQGAHAAGDEDYGRAALRRLSAAVDRGNRRTRFARAAALRDLGEVDLDLSLAEMRRALGDDARLLVDRLWQAHRDAQRSIERLAAQREPGGTVSERVRQRAFDQAVERRVPRTADEGFRAFCYGLIGLGLIRDPVDVLQRLCPWLATSPQDEAEGRRSALAGATALAMLSERGVVDFLESRPLPLPLAADGGDFAFSRLLLAIAGDGEAAARLAEALADALAACSHLPPPLAAVLRANWRAFLVRWGGSVGRCESFDAAFGDLLRGLLPIAAGDAGEETFGLLQSEPCFLGEDGRLTSFAAGVLAGS